MSIQLLNTCLAAICLAAAAGVAQLATSAEPQDELSADRARRGIGELYKAWGQARLTRDAETIEATLDPEFYVLLNDRKISRKEFVATVLREPPNRRLTRFDTDVLTVQPAENGWTVVITEKLEVEIAGSDGVVQKACSLWVTRDGCRKEGDRWIVTYSEAIGYEYWAPGATPPLEDW